MVRGVTQQTFQRLQLGEGAFLKTKYTSTLTDDMILSATRGGATITIAPRYRTRAVDGVPENTKGAKAVDSVAVNASFVALNSTPEFVKRALEVADLTGNIIKLRHKVEDSDYEDLFWLGEISDGRKVQITFKNAFNETGLSLRATQNNEGELSMNFSGNYDLNNLDTPPVEIEFLDA
jgi:hypothetical protein